MDIEFINLKDFANYDDKFDEIDNIENVPKKDFICMHVTKLKIFII